MTLFLVDFLLVSTPILGAGLLLTHLQRTAIARGRILRWAVFASLASPLVRLFVTPAPAPKAAIVVDRVPVDTIGVIWLAVALAILVVLLIRHWRLSFRLSRMRRLEVGMWTESLGVAGGVDAATLAAAPDSFSSPFCLGRTICIPDWMIASLDEEERASVLAHELEHIRRADSGWALFMEIVCAIFFGQPLLLLVKHQLQTVAEERADNAA
ncbi:MAG: M56 family metallopeptidase, partial [Thermoanaerobaculia bacterium]